MKRTFSSPFLQPIGEESIKPLTAYRETLRHISATIIANILLIYGDPWSPLGQLNDEAKKHNEELEKLSRELRRLHAQLLSAWSTIPRFARAPLQLLQLVRSSKQTKEGAQMLIGISNQVLSRDKDRPHLPVIIKRLGTALDIDVGE